MSNSKPVKSFKPGDKLAVECGKKSKRKPLDKELLELAGKDDILIKQALIKMAKKGKSLHAIKEYLDRIYGKSKECIDATITGKGFNIIISENDKLPK